MSSWTELLTHAEGTRRLDGFVAIATPAHTQAIARHLAEKGASAERPSVS